MSEFQRCEAMTGNPMPLSSLLLAVPMEVATKSVESFPHFVEIYIYRSLE